jgi:hypothetical protein
MSRSRGQRRSAWRTLAGKETPAGCPRQASPTWAIALFRGSPGGVWARDIPLYRRAVPGQRHGGPQRGMCSNHTEDGGWQADMADQISSLSGIFGGCIHAGRAGDDQLIGGVELTVVVRWVPGLPVRCGTRVARPAGDEGGSDLDGARQARAYNPCRSLQCARNCAAVKHSCSSGCRSGRRCCYCAGLGLEGFGGR